MSQKKVERYKEYKKNKTQILKREKRIRRLEFGAIAAIGVLFAVWFVVSIGMNLNKVDEADSAETVTAVEVDMNAYANYVNGLESYFTA